jgi:phage shock protein A
VAIFDRISTIMRSNINALLDSAEDPEKMLDQILRDMSSAIGEARGQVAAMIAEEKKIAGDLEQAKRLVEEWDRKAMLAVEKGQDDLAREALRRKKDFASHVEIYETQLAAQSQAVTKLKGDLQLLDAKFEDAKRNRDALIARQKRAKAQQAVTRVSASLGQFDPSADLARMEDRIEREEAMADANAELVEETVDSRFAALERDSEMDDELAALKARMSGAATSESTSTKSGSAAS